MLFIDIVVLILKTDTSALED